MIHAKLKDALIQLEESISAANADGITSALQTLDETVKSNRADLDPQLIHYLERRSYQKALMHLNGEGDIPKGVCQGRKEFR
ncbi:MAG: hypothetical protein AAGB46_17530 [Verrucomicrobiota bacterium]